MSLQFLLGTGHDDARDQLLKKAQDWLSADPKNRVFFLVPNYNKFDQETSILKGMQELAASSLLSTVRLQVFSFYRLAWYFLQKDGVAAGNTLSDAGNAMILRKIIAEEEDNLTVFKGETQKNGFIAQLADFYQELKAGNVTLADLEILRKNQADKSDSQLKLQDLARIYQRFETELVKQEVELSDSHRLLADYLQGHPQENTLFIVSGFAHFSASELQVLQALIASSQLCLHLLLDKQPVGEISVLDLFYDSQKTYLQLKQFADQNKLPVLLDQKSTQKNTPFNQLAAYLENRPVDLAKASAELNEVAEIWKAETPNAEVRQIASEIRRLVAEENYRYQDIQILTRDFELYGELIPTIFKQMEIPFYLDLEQAMADHPLVELIRSLFLMEEYYYRIKDVFRFLKTGLFIPEISQETTADLQKNYQEAIDITENVSLAYHFQGSAWVKEADWRFVDYDYVDETAADVNQTEKTVNHIRQLVQQNLPPFFKKIKNAKTGQEAAQLFYQFLVDSGSQAQLQNWRDQEIAAGNLETARNHEQTWQALIALLDEYVLIYGETEFDWDCFKQIFLTGLENLTYGKIPNALDQVQINNLELAQRQQAKIIFAVGLNEQVLPARFQNSGLLSPEEKELITEQLPEDKYLPEDAATKISREPFLAYLIFLAAQDHLYLSYAVNHDTKKDLQLSPFVARLNRILKLELKERKPLSLTSRPENYVGTYRTLITDLNYLNRQSRDQNMPLLNVWLVLQKYLMKSSQKTLAERVFASQTASNLPENLTADLAEKLYGKNLYVSVSRLESYHKCQFQYFAQYGLRLKERDIYGLTPAAAGDFYHEALDLFFKVLAEKNLQLASLTEQDRNQLAEEVLKEVFGEKRFMILASSPRMLYIRYQLAETIKKTSWALSQQAQRMDFSTLKTEVLFGAIKGQKGIPGITTELSNGGVLTVRGKIDRIDQINDHEQNWLSVVDYKSGKRDFDLVEAYYGLAMQLVTYLDVAVTDAALLTGKSAKPAGAYYLHVNNPKLTKDEKNLEKERLKEYKYTGLFVDEPEILEHFDHTLNEKENSVVFPVKKDAKGNYQKVDNGKKAKRFYTEDELELLIQHNRKNMQKAGEEIICGKIKLNPAYRQKERIACKYCPFRSICGFDPLLPENEYHRLKDLSKDEIIKKIGAEDDHGK